MEPHECKSGKMTLDQFQQAVKKLPELRSNMNELSDLVKTSRKARKALDKDFRWAEIYEYPYIQQIAMLVHVFGFDGQLREMAQLDDPIQAILDWSNQDESDKEWTESDEDMLKLKQLIGLLTALHRNVLSIMLFHRTLDTFVVDVRNGDTSALFKAVRIDRSIMCCPTFADRISRAEIEQDKNFFIHLRSALKGPSKKLWESYRDLRYALCMLREAGFNKLSDAELEDLLVYKLKLYPNTPNARKNLRKQLTESKKFSTTSK